MNTFSETISTLYVIFVNWNIHTDWEKDGLARNETNDDLRVLNDRKRYRRLDGTLKYDHMYSIYTPNHFFYKLISYQRTTEANEHTVGDEKPN